MSTLQCYTDFAKQFRREIDAMMQACDCIHDLEQCEDCPLHYFCLRDTSIEETWSEVSVQMIADFYEYSDDVCSSAPYTDEDMQAQIGDELRKRYQEDGF